MTTTPLEDFGFRAVAASRIVATMSGADREAALLAAADQLLDRCPEILTANRVDLSASVADGATAAVVDRLRLSDTRVAAMASSLRRVASLPDPVGEVIDGWVRPNRLEIRKIRVPLGVVGIIYENRPNVTSDAAGLCLRSANVALLRGSSGALHSNLAIADAIRSGYEKTGAPADALLMVDDASRASALKFMQMEGVIDCLIPRGGHGLIESVKRYATVPYVLDGDGNCHVYVDAHADLDMALDIIDNAKTQRPSVCNAAESLLVHRSVAERFLPAVAARLPGVELRGDPETLDLLGATRVVPATEEDFGREYLDLILSVKVVEGLDEAIDHIRRFGSGHSEAIVTADRVAARRFQAEVDAAAVVVNASTRFTDGEEFGFGAEIGISTQKLHARGPMGLRELTTTKYLIDGTGQIRT